MSCFLAGVMSDNWNWLVVGRVLLKWDVVVCGLWLPIALHVCVGVVLVRWPWGSRDRTTGPFARWRSESTVVRLAARGQAYARTAPFFTRLLSRGWLVGLGLKYVSSHGHRQENLGIWVCPGFPRFPATNAAVCAQQHVRAALCRWESPKREKGRNSDFCATAKTNTNNDCHTADTCLDRRLRHGTVPSQLDRVVGLATASEILGYFRQVECLCSVVSAIFGYVP